MKVKKKKAGFVTQVDCVTGHAIAHMPDGGNLAIDYDELMYAVLDPDMELIEIDADEKQEIVAGIFR